MSCRSPLLLVWLMLAGGCSAFDPVESAPPPRPALPPAHGDRLVSASIGDASNLIPMIAGDAASHEIAGQLYLALLKYDKDLNLVGQLADRWSISSDMRSIRFHLRPGLKWSDGRPFTSADCLFTLRLMQAETTQSPYKSDYDKVVAAAAPDATTFVVHYSEPFSPALATWADLSILPEHVFRGVDIMNTPLSRQPQATIGPYVLADWQSQQSILLRANPNYYDGPVWIEERLTRIIPDPATQFLELTAGHLDSMGLTPLQYRRLFDTKAELSRNYQRYNYLANGYTYLGFNLKHPPFDDPRVREAIALGIDRQELVEGILFGLGEVIETPYKPGTSWVNGAIKPRPFDPAQARALLAAAGWQDSNGDGILDQHGRPLSFTVLTNNGNKQRADTATIIQQRLAEIGIEMKVRLVEWSAFIENFINTKNFDAIILGWSLSPEPDQYAIWHSSQTGPREFNVISYANPAVDAALEGARRTFDAAERKRLYDRFQQELYKDVPIVFLYAGYALPTVHRRVRGIEPAPAGIGHNSEFWYVPAEEQLYKTTMRP